MYILLGYIGIYVLLKIIPEKLNPEASPLQLMLVGLYILSLLFFGGAILVHSTQYDTPIDPEMDCYTPFSYPHFASLNTYFILFNLSALVIWRKGIKLPPILLVLLLTLLFIGLVVNTAVIWQLTKHSHPGSIDSTYYSLLPAPIMVFIIGVCLIVKVIHQKSEEAVQRNYSNKILRNINNFLSNRKRHPFIVILLLLPVFLLITMILTLFGQDTDSIVKVFTDTTTWRLSQQMHPPPLEHELGHYLCTVAACGDPEIVKPLRLGKRGGQPIYSEPTTADR